MTTESLSDRLREGLTQPRTSTELRALISSFEAEKAERVRESALARAVAVDPLSSEDDVTGAKARLSDLDLTAERIGGGVARLRERLHSVEAAERDAENRERYTAAVIVRDAVMVKLREAYPRLARELMGLLDEVAAARDQVQRANTARPSDLAAIMPAEEQAMGCLLNGSAGNWPLHDTITLPARFGMPEGWSKGRQRPGFC